MTQAKPRFRTLEDYLAYDNGIDTRYELVDGELVEMPPENPVNGAIAVFLIGYFLRLGISVDRIGIKHQIAVSSSRVTARDPDLMIHSEASCAAINQTAQSILTSDMPAPTLVVEVVSPGNPGSQNYDRDYVEKRREYALCGIPEYWIIDPTRSVVMVLTLQGNEYCEVGQFRGNNKVMSLVFSVVDLTAEQILSAGR